jgi:hypothetical protein
MCESSTTQHSAKPAFGELTGWKGISYADDSCPIYKLPHCQFNDIDASAADFSASLAAYLNSQVVMSVLWNRFAASNPHSLCCKYDELHLHSAARSIHLGLSAAPRMRNRYSGERGGQQR